MKDSDPRANRPEADDSEPASPASPATSDGSGVHPLVEALSFVEEASVDGTPGARDPIDDEALGAYRRGELDGDDRRDFERRLSRSPAARRRLVELGGGAPPAPSPFLRARVLRAYGRSRRRRPGAAAALGVAAVLLIGVVGFFLRSGGGGLPADLTYAVEARGLAEVRSDGADGAAMIEAYAETPVELSVAPESVADADVEFSVYRNEGDHWIRVAAGEDAAVSRGAAVFRLPASRLAGDAPGRYELLIAVARPGGLPTQLSPGDLEADDGRRRFYRRDLVLLP
ncbi:MAG: hypothetical protein AAGF23_20225 [Acidobacteriota bacterium]